MFEVYKDRNGEWRWRLKAKNGRIVADSAEGFKRKYNAHKNIALVKKIAWEA